MHHKLFGSVLNRTQSLQYSPDPLAGLKGYRVLGRDNGKAGKERERGGDGNEGGREREKGRGWDGVKEGRRKGERRGVVPHPKQKSGFATVFNRQTPGAC